MSKQQVDLVVTGMTCASCASRIERKLNKLESVEARVNYATGLARVEFSPDISIDTLVATVEAAGYHALAPNPLLDEQVALLEATHEKDLRTRWILGAMLAFPIGAMAMFPALQFSQWQLISLILALPIVTWVAWPLHKTSFQNARHRTTTMDTLVSLGILAAYFGSLYQWLSASSHHLYVEVAGVVPVFVLYGRWLESRNKRLAGSALRALIDATPKTALVLREGSYREVSIDDVAIDDSVLIRPESTVTVDGKVIQGSSAISSALLTGEPTPNLVSVGDDVIAGALNHDGELTVRVTNVGLGTQIARIAALVAAAQSGKANIARLADRISAIFVPIVLVITAVTGIAWYVYQPARMLEVMIAVLVIACPCALGLATPTALVVGSGRAASMGILVAGPEVFEKSPQLDTIVFDKTGTLTAGEISVVHAEVSDADLPLVKALVDGSAHPLSRAVNAYLGDIPTISLNDVTALPGLGIRARNQADVVEFGSRKLHPELQLESKATTSYLFVNGDVRGSFIFHDAISQSARETILQMKNLGLMPIVASGDARETVNQIAGELEIETVHAELSPAEKIDLIQSLKSQGHKVVMVGDGTNDAPALAAADLGIAMNDGTEVARATADITLLRPDLTLIPRAIALSRKTLRIIKQNLWWAFGYNVAAIPLAMSGQLNPMIAGIAMSASSVLVVTNSLRLRRTAL